MPEVVPNWARLRAIFASPMLPAVPSSTDARLADAWDAAEERAAIMEYDGGLSREEAEAYAFRNLR